MVWLRLADKCYVLVIERLNWTACRQICSLWNGNVATVVSELEFLTLSSFVNATTNIAVWLGGIFDQVVGWQWDDGEMWTYENFHETNLSEHNFNLAIRSMKQDPLRRWTGRSGSENKHCLCKVKQP